MSERRHRLYTPEIPEVKRGLKLRLQELYEAKEDREAAEIAFRALFRLSRDEPDRPNTRSSPRVCYSTTSTITRMNE